MIRLGSLVGLPAAFGGRMVGCVEQAVPTADGRALRGLILRQGLGFARWAGAESISLLGEAAILLQRRPSRLPRDAAFALGCVRDSNGLLLGRVTDAYVEGESLRIAALEVSLGLAEDLTCGRMLARTYAVHPVPGDPGRVLIPCGCALEKLH